MSAAAVHDYAQTRAGRIAYVRAGAGTPLLLLHGNGHSWHEFADVIAPLAMHHDVIAWDMPGHGRSDDIAPGTPIDAYADILADLIAALGVDSPAILGSSVGGVIASAHGAKGRDASALILAETQFRDGTWWRKAWPMVEAMFAHPVQTAEQVQARLKRRVDDALLDRWNRDRIRAGANLMGVMQAIADFDIAAALPRIAVPALLLFGDGGPTVDRAAAMQAALPGARNVIVPEAGHFVSIDRPDIFAPTVARFLKGEAA